MTAVAVWGAGGFAGSRLCEAAAARGWSVRRLTRESLDFGSSEAAMAAALDGVEIVYHCAGRVADADDGIYAAATARFARACSNAGVRRLVHLSTVAVYGPRWRGEVGRDAPLLGGNAYAESRIGAELGICAALTGSATHWSIVRVPMLVGAGMPGTVFARLLPILRAGIFPHPGPEEATLACIGIGRLAAILMRLPEDGNATFQFADHVRWAEFARRCGARRLRVPNPGGKFSVFASTARYADDSPRIDGELPDTWQDLEILLKP